MIDIKNCWYRISIKALILNEKGEFLLCKEKNGFWDLPGGGLDHLEEPKECIIRELREEMGLEVTDIENKPSYFLTFHKPYNEKCPHIANVCYIVKTKNLDFTVSDECVDIGFFSSKNIDSVKTYENSRILAKQMLF